MGTGEGNSQVNAIIERFNFLPSALALTDSTYAFKLRAPWAQ